MPPANKKAAAENEESLGNEMFALHKFDNAILHYKKAWSLFKDIRFLIKLSTVYFEKQEYKKSIAKAEEAVKVGRKLSSDLWHIAEFRYCREYTLMTVHTAVLEEIITPWVRWTLPSNFIKRACATIQGRISLKPYRM